MSDLNEDGEDLERQLQEYHKAIESEFNVRADQANRDGDLDALKATTNAFFRKHVNLAAAQIVNLAAGSTSDAVRFSASRYIIEKAFDDANSSDPVGVILGELANPRSTP